MFLTRVIQFNNRNCLNEIVTFPKFQKKNHKTLLFLLKMYLLLWIGMFIWSWCLEKFYFEAQDKYLEQTLSSPRPH